MKSRLKKKIRNIDWERGNGESMSFAILSVMICMIFVLMTGLLQLAGISNNLNKAIETIARSVALCKTMDDAKTEAENIADLTIKTKGIGNIRTSIDYCGDSEEKNTDKFKMGDTVTVTLTADVTTWIPTVQHKDLTKKLVVTIEGTTADAGSIDLTGNTNAEKIFNFLVDSGWTAEAAAGAVGNMYQEAGGGGTADINPSSYNGSGGGIAGFTDNSATSQFTELKNFAKNKGKEWTDLQTQCEFLIYQLSHGNWNGMHSTGTYNEMISAGYEINKMSYQTFTQLTDVETATKAFLCFYEDCYMEYAHYEDVRLPMAKNAYSTWG